MVQWIRVKPEEETDCGCRSMAGYEELDMDTVLKYMKKVGHIYSEGYTVLPK